MSNTAQSAASKRIASLLDENSFVEIGAGVTARATDFNMAGRQTLRQTVLSQVTDVINGKLVYVYSQDASVLGGSIGEMHAKKIPGLYDMAMKMGAPVIGLIDCAGLRLQEATDALNAFGEIYHETGNGIRCDSADHSSLWYTVAAVLALVSGYDGLYIYGRARTQNYL